MPRSLDTDA